MTKPEVLFSTASGSSPVGSAAMLTTSVVSARAVPNARNAVQARATIRCMATPPVIASLRRTHVLQAQQSIGEQRETRDAPAQPGDVARCIQIDDRQVLALLLPHSGIGVATLIDVAHRTG